MSHIFISEWHQALQRLLFFRLMNLRPTTTTILPVFRHYSIIHLLSLVAAPSQKNICQTIRLLCCLPPASVVQWYQPQPQSEDPQTHKAGWGVGKQEVCGLILQWNWLASLHTRAKNFTFNAYDTMCDIKNNAGHLLTCLMILSGDIWQIVVIMMHWLWKKTECSPLNMALIVAPTFFPFSAPFVIPVIS